MSVRKKILFILHLPPPVHGAAVVGNIIQQSDLIRSTFECRFINLATASGLNDIGKFKFGKINRFRSLIGRIKHEIRDFQPDLIYITPNSAGNAFYKDWITVQALKRTKIPVVAHLHNKGVSKNASNWVKTNLYNRFFRHLNVILLSQRLFSDIRRFADAKRVYICHNGLPDKSSATDRSQRVSEPPHILFLSNLLIDKGIIILLDALNLLNKQGYDFICDIAGGETAEIDKTSLMDEIAARSLDNKVVYHGPVYGDAKTDLLKETNIFVFPSLNEAFGLVCLEAMQNSLPIVTSAEGGIPDMVIEAYSGFICNPLDYKTIAEKIAILLSDPAKRTEMGKNGRKLYEKNFTEAIFESNLCNILNKII